MVSHCRVQAMPHCRVVHFGADLAPTACFGAATSGHGTWSWCGAGSGTADPCQEQLWGGNHCLKASSGEFWGGKVGNELGGVSCKHPFSTCSSFKWENPAFHGLIGFFPAAKSFSSAFPYSQTLIWA